MLKKISFVVQYIQVTFISERIFMNKDNSLYKLFTVIIASLSLICIVGVVILGALSPSKNDGQSTSSSDSSLVINPTVDSVILPVTEDAGQEYTDVVYFLGDSTTLHFWKGGIDRSHLLVPESGTLMLGSDILSIKISNKVTGKEVTFCEAAEEIKPKILIITVGVNGAANFTEKSYKTYYKKLINGIKDASPNTKIILQSVFPVTSEYSASAITNEAIDKLNDWVKEIAVDCSLHYLDTQSILKNANGAMIEEYSEGDGVHMKSNAYDEIIKYIRTHALK